MLIGAALTLAAVRAKTLLSTLFLVLRRFNDAIVFSFLNVILADSSSKVKLRVKDSTRQGRSTVRTGESDIPPSPHPNTGETPDPGLFIVFAFLGTYNGIFFVFLECFLFF